MEEEKSLNNQEEAEDDAVVSMVEILEAEEKLQEDANAVLGGSDDRNCTYVMVIIMVKIFCGGNSTA